MSISFYRPTGGFFERIHPVTKLLCLLGAFVPPFFSQRPAAILPFFALLILAALFAGAAPNLRRVGKLMIALFVMSVVLWTFFQPGQTPLWTLGGYTIRRESVMFGLTIGIRLNCFVLAAVIFLTCTAIEDFTYGLSRLGVPFVFGFTLSLAFRLTPLFLDTGQTIVQAQQARGLDLNSGGPVTRIRRYVPVIVPVLVSGLRRADQLAVALESKGFGSGERRTARTRHSVGWRDLALALVTMGAGALVGLNALYWQLF